MATSVIPTSLVATSSAIPTSSVATSAIYQQQEGGALELCRPTSQLPASRHHQDPAKKNQDPAVINDE